MRAPAGADNRIDDTALIEVRTSLRPDVLQAVGIDQTTRFEAALGLLNRKVAAACAKPPKRVVIEFFWMPSLMAETYARRSKGLVIGCTSPDAEEPVPIAIMVNPPYRGKWRRTLIHELVHVYSPDAGEARVRKLEVEVTRFLKGQAQQIGQGAPL